MERVTHFLTKGWIVALILAAVAILTFSNGLKNSFLMDDQTFFFSDMKMSSPRLILNYFIPDMRKHLNMDQVTSGASYYRPLAHVLPNSAYLIFKNDTFKHHCFNLLLFVVLCTVIFYGIMALTKDRLLAFITSMLFCVHPINGLMVNYITAQIFSVQLMFMIGCAVLFWKADGFKWSTYLGLSLGCFVLALLCHETSLGMPFYLIILWAFKYRQRKASWQVVIPYVALFVGYMLFRMYFASLKVSVLDKYAKFNITPVEYIASFMHVIGWYLSKLVALKGVVLIWVTQVVTEALWLHLVALVLAIGMLTWLLRFYYKKDVIVFGALIWFLIGFLPVAFACLFKPKHGIMFEPHWMFFASLGFFVFIASLLKHHLKQYALIGMLVLMVPCILVSRMYNQLWKDQRTYCEYWLKEVPGFPSAAFLLADVYVKEGRFDEARDLYLMTGKDAGVLNNLGLIELKRGRIKEAKEAFMAALEDNPKASFSYVNLAGIEFEAKNYIKAEEYLLKAMSLNAYQLASRRILIKTYILQNKFDAALPLAEDSVKLFPDDDRIRFILMMLHVQKGNIPYAQHLGMHLAQHADDKSVLNDTLSVAKQYRFNNIIDTISKRQK